jgi:U3 small nucleolar RNA-associated protein 20
MIVADGQAVSDPKAWAERKSKKGVIKKDSKKRRVKAFA